MTTIQDCTEVLGQLAPLSLAEEWDNVGLLVGDPQWPAARIMTCLTVTAEVAEEAVQSGAQLIVSHHPLPFRPLQSITASTTTGKLLLQLIPHSVGVYSAHTSFDSAATGINQHLSIGLGLHSIAPLRVGSTADPEEGSGRCGALDEPATLRELAYRAQQFLGSAETRCAGDPELAVERVAIACGSGGSFLNAALEAGCDALLTGEATYHQCLEATAHGKGIVLVGHYASERFAVESLADFLADQLPDVTVWASRRECDPIWRLGS